MRQCKTFYDDSIGVFVIGAVLGLLYLITFVLTIINVLKHLIGQRMYKSVLNTLFYVFGLLTITLRLVQIGLLLNKDVNGLESGYGFFIDRMAMCNVFCIGFMQVIAQHGISSNVKMALSKQMMDGVEAAKQEKTQT